MKSSWCWAFDFLAHDECQIARKSVPNRSARYTKYSYTMTPFAIERDGEFHKVGAHVVGSFEGSPIDMNLRFRLESGLVASMEITV